MRNINHDTSRLFELDLVTDEQAHQILQAYYVKIVGCINTAFAAANALREATPDKCTPLKSRTWASIIHDYMVSGARRVFADSGPDVLLSSEGGFLIIDFRGMIKMRFKKLRGNLHPCNVKTGQQRAYETQTLYAGGATLVTAGYRVDAAGLFRDAHVVCWSGPELRWSLRLPDIDELQLAGSPVAESPLPVTVVKCRKPKQGQSKRTS